MSTLTERPAATAAPTRTGTLALARLALRRDRVRLPIWVLGITVSLLGTAAMFPGLYPDAAARQARATIMASPAAVALGGPRIGLDDYTFGAMMTNEMLGMVAVVVALMAIFTVVRHSRAEEEDGRAELVLAGVVGRRAPTTAALVVAVGASALVGALCAVGLGATGLDSITWPGSVLYGAALAATGLVFAAVAAVTVQLTEHARTASGLAGLALGVAYAVRAVGDVTQTWISWLSPIAWAQRTEAYVANLWWPLALSLAAAVALLAVAGSLAGRRDLGSGLRAPRPGPPHASARLRDPFSLAARLERGTLVAWVVSIAAFGLLYGTLLAQVETFAGDLSKFEAVLAGFGVDDVVKAFLSLLAVLLSLTGSVVGVLSVQRARREEESGRADAVLTGPVPRARWLGAFATLGAAGGAAVLLAGALGVGLSGSAVTGDVSVLGGILVGALVQLTPLLAVVGLAVGLYGWWPRALPLAWVVLGYGTVVAVLGGLLGLPDWARRLSPFQLVPLVPGEPFTPWPVLAMLACAVLLVGAGLRGIARRDLGTG